MEEEGRVGGGLDRFREWLTSLEWPILLVLALIVAGSWIFVGLADLIVENERQSSGFDEALLLALREPQDVSDPIGPGAFEAAVRDVTALGSAAVLSLITVSTAILLILRGNHRTAIILVIAIVGGTLLSVAFKDLFARPRPTLVPVEVRLSSFSFPSGHAMLAAVTYLTSGTLLARTQSRPVLKIYIMAVALFITVAVGLSRVYLGVHWPTDVLAGWTAGVVWALMVWLVANKLPAGNSGSPNVD